MPDNSGYCHRAVIARLARVKAAILHATAHLERVPAPVTIRTLAERLEVSEKTIWRDLELLRDMLGHQIEYDAARHTYFYRVIPEPVL